MSKSNRQSEFALNMVDALQCAEFNEHPRSLSLEGPFGPPNLMIFQLRRTFHTLRGTRGGLIVIACGHGEAPTELQQLAQQLLDAHGITAFFHTGRVPPPGELAYGGAPVLQPDSVFTENKGHFLDDPRPSIWIVYEFDVKLEVLQLVRLLDIALTRLGWRVETDYKHEEKFLQDGDGWGLVVRDLAACDCALSVRTVQGLEQVNSFGGIQGPGGLRGIQYELELLQLVRKPYPSTLLESWHGLSDREFDQQVRDLDEHLREDFLPCDRTRRT